MLLVLFSAESMLPGPVGAESLARTLYVATNGSDRWSGTLPAPDPTGKDGPFATLQRARNSVREFRMKYPDAAYAIQVREGVYHLNETFVLEPEDSGTEANPFIIKAYGNERPILTGTRNINNFEPWRGKIHKAVLSGMIDGADPVRQLFANGKRQTLARYPNANPSHPERGDFLYIEEPSQTGSKREFKYTAGSLPEWVRVQDAEINIFPGSNWSNDIGTLSAIDRKKRKVTLSRDLSYEIKTGNRYFIQNLLEALDIPGEWYYDRAEKTLYFLPEDEMSLRTASIPVLENLVEIRGKKFSGRVLGKPSNIRFEGFTLEGCKGIAILLKRAEKTVIAGNTIYNTGADGIEIDDGSDNAAVGNDVHHVGWIGIKVSGGDRATLTPANNRVDNNYVHDTGIFGKGQSAISCKGVGNVVSHNLIHSAPRVGIWFDGNDHLIEYNHVHHVNAETEDSGLIYSSQLDWTKRGTVIQFNHLHDSGGYGLNNHTGTWQTPFRTYGIYLDAWTSGTRVYGNIIHSTWHGSIFIHGGRDNTIENNVIVEGGDLGQIVYSGYSLSHPDGRKFIPLMYQQLQKTRYEKYPRLSSITSLESGERMSGNSFCKNIVMYKNPHSPLYGIYNDIDLSSTVSDYNIIYHYQLPLLISFMKSPPNQQWITWQAHGLDNKSIIVNPLFNDVVKRDFRLSSNSPALRRGFQQIPIEKIGLYASPMRASWPPPSEASTSK